MHWQAAQSCQLLDHIPMICVLYQRLGSIRFTLMIFAMWRKLGWQRYLGSAARSESFVMPTPLDPILGASYERGGYKWVIG